MINSLSKPFAKTYVQIVEKAALEVVAGQGK